MRYWAGKRVSKEWTARANLVDNSIPISYFFNTKGEFHFLYQNAILPNYPLHMIFL
jgi:hypothetical protein